MQYRPHQHFNPKKPAKDTTKTKKKKSKCKKAAPSLQSKQKPAFVPKIQTIPTTYTGYFDIDKYSHHFVVKHISPIGQQLLVKFANNYIQWGWSGFGAYSKRIAEKIFAARVKPLNHWRFHTGQWKEFVQFLSIQGVDIENIKIQTFGFHPASPLDAEITKEKTPFDYQVGVINYLKSPEPSKIKLVEIQAGKGKTFCASSAAAVLNSRIVMFLKNQFIEKWVGDLEELLGIQKHEVLVIKGSDSLIAAIHGVMSGEIAPKAIIVSNRTFQNWIKLYETMGDEITEIYGCAPHEFCQALRAGLRLIDEVHLDFHLNFKIDLYTHVQHSISLSATLISDKPFLARMQELAYPKAERYNGMAFDKYVDSIAVKYSVVDASIIDTTERGNDSYSHNAFEKSVMRNHKLLQGYLSMIERLAIEHYEKRADEGDKCLIYCSSIAMCTIVSDFLKRSFPDKVVRRYVEDDPYVNLMESDISVSTVQSAGTGHDIPGLITVILTTSLNSSASNIQGFGRLRKLKGKKTVFVFISCMDIPRHLDYYDNKMKLLKTRALSLKEITIYDAIDKQY